MDKATPEDTLATHVMLDPGVQAKLIELLVDALMRGSAIRDDGTEDRKVVDKFVERLETVIEQRRVARDMRMRRQELDMRIAQQQNTSPPQWFGQSSVTAVEDQRSWLGQSVLGKALGLK
jgi:hypothetical protein